MVLEILVPYRQGSVSKVKRWINNIALTVFNSLILQLNFNHLLAMPFTKPVR